MRKNREYFENLMKCYDLDSHTFIGAEHTMSEESVQRWFPLVSLSRDDPLKTEDQEKEKEEHLKEILELKRKLLLRGGGHGGSKKGTRDSDRRVDFQQKMIQLRLLQNKRRMLLRRSMSHMEFSEQVNIKFFLEFISGIQKPFFL